MRLLIWSDTFYPHIGGVEVMGEQFVRALHARGHEIVIVAGPHQPDESDPQWLYDIPIYRFPFVMQTGTISVEAIIGVKQRMGQLLASFRPDLFHFFQTSNAFFLHTLRAKREAAPVLLTLHSPYFVAAPAVNQARRHLIQQVDWTTVCSHFILNDTLDAVPAITGRASTIHNSLPMPNIKPSALDFDAPRVLFVGRLVPAKGVDVAIDAFARVLSQVPRARLVIAGDGDIATDLRAQVERLGIQAAVEFLGWVNPYDVPAVLNQATVVLVPSHAEAFGLVALQAGQMARPVVSTRVGGLPQVVVDGETGLLVERGDAAAMAAALVTLLTQPDHARTLGAAARQHVQRAFGWDGFIEQYEALYTRLAEPNKVPSQARSTCDDRAL